VTAPAWKLSPGKRSTNWTGRMFLTFQAAGPEGVHRSVTVIMRHDRQSPMLATGRQARRFALRALVEQPGEVHRTIDPDDLPGDWWYPTEVTP